MPIYSGTHTYTNQKYIILQKLHTIEPEQVNELINIILERIFVKLICGPVFIQFQIRIKTVNTCYQSEFLKWKRNLAFFSFTICSGLPPPIIVYVSILVYTPNLNCIIQLVKTYKILFNYICNKQFRLFIQLFIHWLKRFYYTQFFVNAETGFYFILQVFFIIKEF